MHRRSHPTACALSLLLSLLPSAPVRAQSSEAEVLFSKGKRELSRANYEKACPLLEASFRVEEKTGTLLALAICHESQGKLATAYREYWAVVNRAHDDGRKDREALAREKLAAIAPRLSTLTIHPPEGQADLPVEVKVDGVQLDVSQLGAPMAMEPGAYEIEVTAPGKEPWTSSVTMGAAQDAQILNVPWLLDLPGSQPVMTSPPPTNTLSSQDLEKQVRPARWNHDRAEQTEWGTAQWIGLSTVGLGAGGVVVGAVYSLNARKLEHDADRCTDMDEFCATLRKENRADARQDRTSAWIAYGASAAAVAVGLAVFLFSDQEAVQKPSPIRVSGWGTKDEIGAVIRRTF